MAIEGVASTDEEKPEAGVEGVTWHREKGQFQMNILVLRSFSSEIFSAITGLIGPIVGVLLTSKG